MGVFDTVIVKCPECGHLNDLQTRSGDCTLASYSTRSVPVDIARAIDGVTVHCSECDYDMTITWPADSPTHVRMIVS